MTDKAAEAGEAEPPRRGIRRVSKTAWAILTGALALIGTVAGLIFTLDPSLKPDPLDRIGAEISVVAVDANVTIGAWAPQAYPKTYKKVYQQTFDTTNPTPDKLGVLGDMIYVNTQVDGYKHRAVTLSWAVYSAAPDGGSLPNGGRIDIFKEIPAPKILPLPIDSPSRSSIQLLFVPAIGQLPDAPKTFVRIELSDPADGQVLAVTDTPTLTRGVSPRR